MADLGDVKREIYVEPMELPIPGHVPAPAPQPERAPMPAPVLEPSHART